MKHIANALGMDEPDYDEQFGTDTSTENSAIAKSKENLPVPNDEGELPIPAINDRLEDALINEGYEEVQKLINHATAHGVQIAELARDMEPRYKARLLEVSSQMFKTALDSIKQKQDMAFKNKEHKFKRATTGAPSQVSNTQVNNYFASRDEIMDLIQSGTIASVDTEENPDD